MNCTTRADWSHDQGPYLVLHIERYPPLIEVAYNLCMPLTGSPSHCSVPMLKNRMKKLKYLFHISIDYNYKGYIYGLAQEELP